MKSKGPSSSFLKVKCDKCKNEQVIFNKAATKVKCLVCGKDVADSKGGKAKVLTKKVDALN